MRALINTAYIERLDTTLRARLATLAYQSQAGAHRRTTLSAGMWLVGATYNLVWVHRPLAEGHTPATGIVTDTLTTLC
jgi:hypothetical protein